MSNLTARQALKIARENAFEAKRRGERYNDEFELADGRTLYIGHAEAAESSQSNRCYLFGVWVYSYGQDGRERRLKL